MKFLDQAKIYMKSGDGGTVAFRSVAKSTSSTVGQTAVTVVAAAMSLPSRSAD